MLFSADTEGLQRKGTQCKKKKKRKELTLNENGNFLECTCDICTVAVRMGHIELRHTLPAMRHTEVTIMQIVPLLEVHHSLVFL